jgi:N-acetylneuraminate synthase/N,N'-diacetyllegionaminate synthase
MDKVIVIAEAGVNHNGDINLAKQLILAAKDAGADYVKFQTFITELNISKNAQKAAYQQKNTRNNESQFEMVKKLELTFDNFSELNNFCDDVGIKFLSTAFDFPSIDFLDSLNPPYFKVPSGEITHKRYLQKIAQKGRKIILSTGMADMEEINDAINILTNEGIKREQITVLHCNTEYPTPMKDVNLNAMQQIANALNVEIGYSDHTLGTEIPIAAVALGAKIIEKHFTLDRTLSGPDHIASLEPTELKLMIHTIRNVEAAISGSGMKYPSNSEEKNKLVARKSLHASRDLISGDVLTDDDIIALRPGTGISPMEIDFVIGKTLLNDIAMGQQIQFKDLK